MLLLLVGCGSFGITPAEDAAAPPAPGDGGVTETADGGGDGSGPPTRCYALSFDGDEDWVEVPDADDLDPTGPSTIEAWVELTKSASELHVLAHHDHYAATGYVLMVHGTTSALVAAEARYYDGAANNAVFAPAVTSPFPRNDWTHVAATYDGANIAIWVDGERKAQRSVSKSPPNANFNGVLKIGHNVKEDNFGWGGRIDEVRISRGVRYSSKFTPQERFDVVDTDTIALWHFDEGEGTKAHDATGKHEGTLVGDVKWSETSCERR